MRRGLHWWESTEALLLTALSNERFLEIILLESLRSCFRIERQEVCCYRSQHQYCLRLEIMPVHSFTWRPWSLTGYVIWMWCLKLHLADLACTECMIGLESKTMQSIPWIAQNFVRGIPTIKIMFRCLRTAYTTRAQLLLRWLRNVALVDFLLSS